METRILDSDFTEEFTNAAFRYGSVALDIETNKTLKAKEGRVTLLTGYVPGYGFELVRHIDPRPDHLLYMMQERSVKKVFHHAPFDLSFLMHHYYVNPVNVRDTKLAAKIIDPFRTEFASHSLGAMVNQVLNIHVEKDQALSDWEVEELSPDQIRYAKEDVAHLLNLHYALEQRLIEYHKLAIYLNAAEYLPTHVELQLRDYKDVFGY